MAFEELVKGQSWDFGIFGSIDVGGEISLSVGAVKLIEPRKSKAC